MKMKENSNLIFRNHHLVMNPGQGPHLKCAPRRNSIKDTNIIKSYRRGRGVIQSETFKHSFWAILERCFLILVQPMLPMHQNKIFLGICILVHLKVMISSSGKAWDRKMVTWPCTKIPKSRKC